ncbi:MBL fold metallo-hydrolase [Parabacteroides massiliensis]|uniref:MBL fold metallo-hydrolase n=1 Tax=Parabacteroides massiliensis TaxID=1750560 RepID=UPI00096A8929|nr:MBL fold metallo-hydrolase [Parabacteroides massiliensis]
MDIQLIDTGFFHADGGAMFGAIPKTAWSRRYPSDEQNGCILAMRSVLVRDGNGRIILVDNGAGNKHLKQLSYYKFFDLVDLKDELQSRGVACEDVTDVVLTHLHFDHCGYTTQKEVQPDGKHLLKMTFPNATHWVSRAQWENFLHPNALEADSYFIENMQAVCDSGKLRLIESDTTLCPGVDLRLFDGHTPGQIAPYITTSERTYVFAGDVIPLAASVSPLWISAYDTCPVVSYNEKIRMLEEATSKKQAIIYCHDAYTRCSTVKKVNDFFTVDQKEQK